MAKVRTRYAPSPTGHLHIGGARTALFSYLWARKNGGSFVVRIEDTDVERNVADAEKKQMEALKWLGIDWDESVDVGGPHAPYRSMERLDLYQTHLDKLLEGGQAYPCYCTQEELDREREKQLAEGVAPKYSGRCRHLSEEEREAFEKEGRVPSIRFRVPEGRTITVRDEVRGEVRFDSDGVGDFIIQRPDGRPTYNFAVVVDDALMEITHVVRAEEHLSNTPRQILLYEALGFEPPVFAHASLILNPDGKKMSKRDESVIQFIDQYRELGYLPESIINFLVLLGWAPEGEKAEEEIFSKEELIDLFSLKRVSKAPAVFDTGKLKWMNNHYIKESSTERITDLAIPHLARAGRISENPTGEELEWVSRLVGLYKEQLDYVAQIVELTEMFFREEARYSGEAKEVLSGEQVPEVVEGFIKQLETFEGALTPGEVKALLKTVQKETGHKGKKLFMPIRAAVTGEVHGPDLRETICLLGKEKVLARLKGFLERRDQILA
ncbi:glutamyl-tRNA synthetase /glutamate--tRNA(Gln) ligase [Melghirimyces profundicolus]|uniref:Glutamate--tRNA ligase n=1 Tax=Melghirimyces profundicolus TaxID=1242148 RepID=A0A2T6BPY5_9BACL|nr:glutamate--tRNA ligase [Melghirimyces profundicolus]PTX58153.1 glutamyl-tRNA synthetase /glutamate--tRNA(Gln) ligase [Melghirimyces profundicolus]